MSVSDRPNIIVIMTDQQFAGAMSCAGNPYLSTPAMDSIAAKGVQFTNAYCTFPLCIPARESIFTGRMPFDVGYRQWGDAMTDEARTAGMGFHFQKAGYDCAFGGKVHAPNNDATEHGFQPICGQNDNELADACITYLEEARSEPFLLFASFDNPHNICEWARCQNLPWGSIPEAAIEDCPDLPPNFSVPPYEPQFIRLIQERFPLAYPMRGASPDDWRRYRHAYYRLVERADREIGRVLACLRRLGLDQNTIIVFTSDHGDGHGAHQWNQKSILYEECVRVPLLVSYPGVPRAGACDRRLVSSGLDILPTLCDLAGLPVPPAVTGRSLRPLLERPADSDDDPPWRDEIVVETWPFQGDPGRRSLARMVRTSRYKYAVYSWGRYREQLFDLERDPGEMVNLAVSARHLPVLQEHRDRLRRWCLETGDEFLPAIPR